MSESLFVFTLGPIQSFIAEARRTSDLYLGSRILVEMTVAAAQAVPGELIFPTSEACGKLTVPNRFVAVIDCPGQEAAEAAQKAAQAVWNRYATRARSQLERFGGSFDATFNEIWNRQASQHLEFYWATCLLGKEYNTQTYLLQAALDARKRTREFEASEERGQKDSLSGMRSGLLTKQDRDSATYWQRVAASRHLENRSILKSKGERLDAIGAIKRFGDDVNAFPSTSTVAAATFLLAVAKNPASKQALEHHGKTAGKLGFYRIKQQTLFHEGLANWGFDGAALYTATLTPKRLDRDYGITDEQRNPLDEEHPELQAARESLRTLHKEVGHQPNLYYAVLKMDGDHMAAYINNCDTQDDHQALSDRLARFAEAAKQIVNKEFAGRLVYSGGDDVLALAPVEQVIPLAKRLRDEFKKITEVSGLSGGIVMAHHLDPLDRALRVARAAEKSAKKNYRGDTNRDAICVVALKRSGKTLQVGTRWDLEDGTNSVALFETLCAVFSPEGALSSKMAYDAFEELPAFAEVHPGPSHLSALKRIIKRHLDSRVSWSGPVKAEELAEGLNHWAADLGTKGAAELVNWLLLARFVAGGGRE